MAEEIKVGERFISISSIDGFCLMNPSINTDREILIRQQNNLSPKLHLITIIPRCTTLKKYRAYISSTFTKLFTPPPKLEVYFQTYAIKASLKNDLRGEKHIILDKVCPAMSDKPTQIDPQDLTNKQTEQTFLTNLKSGEVATLGLLLKTQKTCYLGALKKNTNQDKSHKIALIIAAPQILDGLSVIHSFVAPYNGVESIQESVEKLQKFIVAQ
ncbi:hypothetical protein [Kiloniella majae]|uniref:hypothetical protein n=1 Tax=Kiloniella majae TaxID=1938558 RepID=UPI000F7B27F9|nr:hypothetical protein [Kiloniella majae]